MSQSKIQANLQKETAINLAQDSLILFYQDKQIETKLSELAIQDNLTEVIEIAFGIVSATKVLAQSINMR
jgi:hypothetical protein